jgi:hypothetical protein
VLSGCALPAWVCAACMGVRCLHGCALPCRPQNGGMLGGRRGGARAREREAERREREREKAWWREAACVREKLWLRDMFTLYEGQGSDGCGRGKAVLR